jgi:hypothetical protein
MAFYFTFDDEGRLSWTVEGGGKPTLTDAQAAIVANSEAAWQLRNIAEALSQIAEEIRDASHRQSKGH